MRGASKNELCKTEKIVLPLTTQFELYINYKKIKESPAFGNIQIDTK